MENNTVYNQLRLQHFDGRLYDMERGWKDVKNPHKQSQLWLVMDGGGYLKVGEKEYRLTRGDFCLLPDTVRVEYGCDREEHLQMWGVGMYSKVLSVSLFDWLECSQWVVPLSGMAFEECLALMERLHARCTQKHDLPPLKHLELNRDLHALLVMFLSMVTLREKKQESWLGNVLQYIDEHPDKPLTVEVLAKRAALHPNYFIQRFHMQVGMSPAKYVADVRIKYAQALLAEDIPLVEVAAKVGFADVPSFSRFFRRHIGMSPQQYQHKQREGV